MKIWIGLLVLFLAGCNSAQVKKFLDGARTSQGPVPLTQSEVVAGLKEALVVGARQSADLLHKPDAFLGNPAIRIPFPPRRSG